MVDTEAVLEKLRHVRAALERISQKNPRSQDDLFSNPDTQDVVLRNMQNALQGCLDIASHIVAVEEWGQPTKSTDFFTILGERKVITLELAQSMARLAKFRNILVHEYTRLDLQKTWEAVSLGTERIQRFCHAIALWISPS